MNPHREKMLADQEAADKELFEKIQNNPKPDMMDLWALSPDRFYEWRKLNDFPRLLNHFDDKLILFKEWKEDNKLTNEVIIDTGYLTPFLENKKFSKKKTLYLEKQVLEGKETRIVSDKKLEGKITFLARDFFFTPILEFTSYLDWLKERGKFQKILNITSRTAPRHPLEKVSIHSDVYSNSDEFILLKMGGIAAPVNDFGLLCRGKRMEFVNLCGLVLAGEIYFGELGNLSCSYCACDNWFAKDLIMPNISFDHCSVTNFTIINSKIQQWSFYNCDITGDFDDSQLQAIRICGGNFTPVMNDCKLFNVNILVDKPFPDNNLYGYKLLKKIYADQGDEGTAKYYFIRENEFIRKRLKGLNYITKTMSYYYWEYGRKPHRIIWFSVFIILFCSIFYWLNSSLITLSPGVTTFTILDSIYFSTSAFTTLGYGDMCPLGWLRGLTLIEAFAGVINMGFLIAGYSTNKY
jgi:ion channel